MSSLSVSSLFSEAQLDLSLAQLFSRLIVTCTFSLLFVLFIDPFIPYFFFEFPLAFIVSYFALRFEFWALHFASWMRLGVDHNVADKLGNRPALPIVIYDIEHDPLCKIVRETCNHLDIDMLIRPCPDPLLFSLPSSSSSSLKLLSLSPSTSQVPSSRFQPVRCPWRIFLQEKYNLPSLVFPYIEDPNVGFFDFHEVNSSVKNIIAYLHIRYQRLADGKTFSSLPLMTLPLAKAAALVVKHRRFGWKAMPTDADLPYFNKSGDIQSTTSDVAAKSAPAPVSLPKSNSNEKSSFLKVPGMGLAVNTSSSNTVNNLEAKSVTPVPTKSRFNFFSRHHSSNSSGSIPPLSALTSPSPSPSPTLPMPNPPTPSSFLQHSHSNDQTHTAGRSASPTPGDRRLLNSLVQRRSSLDVRDSSKIKYQSVAERFHCPMKDLQLFAIDSDVGCMEVREMLCSFQLAFVYHCCAKGSAARSKLIGHLRGFALPVLYDANTGMTAVGAKRCKKYLWQKYALQEMQGQKEKEKEKKVSGKKLSIKRARKLSRFAIEQLNNEVSKPIK